MATTSRCTWATPLVCLGFAAAAGAADFSPTRFDDPVPDGCAPGDCSLREAVLAANAAAGADRVLLSAGDYVLTLTGSTAGDAGALGATESVEVRGAGRDLTRILPALGVQGVLFSFGESTAIDLRLSALAVEGFVGFDTNPMVWALGPGSVRLSDVALRNNSSEALVAVIGGLWIEDSVFESNSGTCAASWFGPVSVTGSRFSDNSSDSSTLQLGNDSDNGIALGTVVLRGNTFERNLALDNGAAVSVTLAGGLNVIDLSDSTFVDNQSNTSGGAVWVHYADSAVETTRLDVVADGARFEGNGAQLDCGALGIERPATMVPLVEPSLHADLARFAGNEAIGSGGALCVRGTTTLRNTTFSGNLAGSRGGAILHAAGLLTVENSTFADNDAGTFGGAVWAGAPVEVRRSTLEGNSAGTSGGALYVSGTGESLLRHATLFGNRANGLANGVRVVHGIGQAVLRLDNSILQGGCSASSPDALADSQQNIESPGDTCDLGFNNSVNVGAAALQLGPLTDNGGPTLTRMPLAGSPALNRVLVIPSCTIVDQRGYVGTGGSCDSGSVEAAAVSPLPEVFADGFE